jgi:GMP synthase-like glutamine amidotransferase
MKEIICLQHVAYEGPGAIADWAKSRELNLRVWRMDEQGHAPEFDQNYPLVIVLGGPMNVEDDIHFPWLRDEKRFLFRQLNRRGRMLGICLGAQLLANLLGASVEPMPEREIGWFPLQWTPEAQSHPFFAGHTASVQNVLHWHGQSFGLPTMGTLMASSEACTNQAFVWKERVVGLQFHLEIGLEEVKRLSEHSPSDLAEAGRWVQDRAALMTAAHEGTNRALLYQLLDQFFLPLKNAA